MDISNLKLPPQVKLKEFRNLTRSFVRSFSLEKEKLLSILETDHQLNNSQEVLDFMVGEGLFKKESYGEDESFSPTLRLRSIASANLHKRKSLDEAWQDVAKMVARTVALKQSSFDWTLQSPTEIHLFGSLLNDTKADYGDADLIVGLASQNDFSEKQHFEKQQNWLRNHQEHVSHQAMNESNFSDGAQLKVDIRHMNSFISLHSFYEVYHLNEVREDKNTTFPVMSLWINNQGSYTSTEEDYGIVRLESKWKDKNPEAYQKAINNFHQALSKIGIDIKNVEQFETQCREYVIRDFAQEYIKICPDLEPRTTHQKVLFYQMMRMDEQGMESLGRICNKKGYSFESLHNIIHDDNIYKKGFNAISEDHIQKKLEEGWLKENEENSLKKNLKNKIKTHRDSKIEKKNLNLVHLTQHL